MPSKCRWFWYECETNCLQAMIHIAILAVQLVGEKSPLHVLTGLVAAGR